MTEMVPPVGDVNLPVKEMKPEKTPAGIKKGVKGLKKAKKAIYFLFIILLLVFFLGGIFLGSLLKQKKAPKEVSPSPSVEASPILTPSPSMEAKAEGLEGRVETFEKKLEEADLKEQELSPPALDFDIRFDIKE